MNVNKMVFVVVIGLALGAEAGFFDSVVKGVGSVAETVSRAAEASNQLQGTASGRGSESASMLTNAPSADSVSQLPTEGRDQCQPGDSIAKDERKSIERKTAQNSEVARGSAPRKAKEDDGGWRAELEGYGYSEEEIVSLLAKIREMSSEGFSKDAIRGILEIKDKKVAAETKKKDAEELAKLNIDDLKSLSKTDREVLDHIDQELTPLLVRKGTSASEIKEMKKMLLVQLRKVDEAKRLAAARHTVHEMIRMHNLDK